MSRSGGTCSSGWCCSPSAWGLNLENLRERLGSGEARRASKYGTSAIVSTLLGVTLLGMLGFVSTRYTHRFDWSEQKVHSLTDQTQKVIASLDRDVLMTAFFGELDAPPVRDLLERYTYVSDRMELQFADPNERPDLVATLGVDEAALAGGLVRIAMGDDSVELSEFSEEKVTNALVQLSRPTDRKVYFLMGHNEREIAGEGGEAKEGFDQAANALRNENYQVEPLVVAQVGGVPDDANAVVIGGPTRQLPQEELDALREYVEGGGGVLLMLDPRARTNLVDFASGWGVVVGDDIIVDLELAFFQQYMSPFAGAYAAEHPITQPMGDQRDPTLFHVARSVEKTSTAGDGVQTIVFTGEKSWAERDLDEIASSGKFAFGDRDLMGPVPVAATIELAVEGETPSEGSDGAAKVGRVVVIGDSDFASNEFVARYGGNRDLFVNSVNWLLGDVEAISVRPHLSRASRFTGTEEEVRAIQYLSVFVLPEAIAIVGVFAWWSRRKAPGR